MSLKGGYKIINFNDLSLSNTPVTIAGIYDSIENNFRKPLLVSGINFGGTEKADAFAFANVDSGNFVITVYGKNITVTDDDEVTVATATTGKTYYRHHIKIDLEAVQDEPYFTFYGDIITNTNTPFTLASLKTHISTVGQISVYGRSYDGVGGLQLANFANVYNDAITVWTVGYNEEESADVSTVTIPSTVTFTDTVTEI